MIQLTHLWQSTVFAAVVAVLVWTLRNNHARTRYWLWLIASVKFLIPFSLLVTLGRQWTWPAARPGTQPAASFVVEYINQPLVYMRSTARPIATQHLSMAPDLLFAVWLCGVLVVAYSWWRRWRQIQVAVRAATPLALDLEVPVLSSPALLEPGVFGVFRPAILLPEGIAERLAPAQLNAVLAHELCHVRRHDNLAAMIHMAVEALFWFHPLVWWIGARLVEERERACDAEVLRLGNEPEVYAGSILKTCEYYLESPLVCVSGITGSDLEQRVIRIMTCGSERKLNLWRKLLLVGAGMVAIGGPVLLGHAIAPQAPSAPVQKSAAAPSPKFDIASIKVNRTDARGPMIHLEQGGRLKATKVPLKFLIEMAYDLKEAQIIGLPASMSTEGYDIEAKPDEAGASALDKLPRDQAKDYFTQMVQSLLVDRFQLRFHHETKELPVFALLVAKNGPKFKETALSAADLAPRNPQEKTDKPPVRQGVWFTGRGHLEVTAASLDMVTNVLSMQLGHPVVDQTGLKGKYDFKLVWTPEEHEGAMFQGAGAGAPGEAPPPADNSGPTIYTAVQEQLGLKLESKKSPMDVLVIDRIEKPTEN